MPGVVLGRGGGGVEQYWGLIVIYRNWDRDEGMASNGTRF